MRILVTGGAGFIGSNFVRMIFEKQFPEISDVVVLDKLTYAGNLKNLQKVQSFSNFQFIQGDICDTELVGILLGNIDAIINFAAESHVDRSISGVDDFVRSNIVGVQSLLDAIVRSKKGIRFVQISTDEVYGSILSGSWVEDSPVLPNSPYAATKASGELLVNAYHKTYGIDTVLTRGSNNYGPFQFPEKLIPLFITNLIEDKSVPIYGKGINVRDWLHVDDHCRGIYLALTRGISGQTYNIGGGEEFTNLEVTSLILKALDKDESHIKFVEDRKGHDLRYSLDWSKARTMLAYAPSKNFEEGLSSTIDWYKFNQAWWKPLKQH